MSPGVVPTAGQSKNKSAVAGMAVEVEAIDSREKCIQLYVPLACGKNTQVPFEPRDGRPVYCSDCYSKSRR